MRQLGRPEPLFLCELAVTLWKIFISHQLHIPCYGIHASFAGEAVRAQVWGPSVSRGLLAALIEAAEPHHPPEICAPEGM